MESLLGFNENAVERSRGYKLVPWLRWDEWNSVRESLFSSSPDSVSSALQRIMAWRSRGCLPIAIEVTASIIEIQQKDPFFRIDLGDNASESEEMLAMLYCMAIMRLVNGVVEKTRKKTEVSIAEAADGLNIPRMLIDIRHEGSHRDLPSLRLVRLASIKALDWLKSYYWEPQQKAIPFQSDGTACLRKKIKSRLCELALRLKVRQPTSSSSSLAKGIKHFEPFCGRNKFLSRRFQHPKFAGSRKQINLTLKHIVQLYSSYSSEVVSVLVELLLKGSDCLDVTGLSKYYEVRHDTNHAQSVFDDWKPVISKVSNKEPQLLLTLVKAVLEMIETRQAMKYGSDNIGSLLDLFEWLVRNLKELKHVGGEDTAAVTEASSIGICLPKVTLVELLRRTLLVSCPGNNQLRNSASVLAQMIGNDSSLVEKLNKLYLLWESNPMIDDENCSIISYDSILAQQEDSIHQAAEKLELVKRCRKKSKANMLKTTDGDVGNNSRWVVPKSWNSCPIGMLPCDVGSSGRLPVLDLPVLDRDEEEDDNNNNKNNAEAPNPSESKQQRALKEGGIHKRGPECNIEALDESCVKKMRETEDARESDGKDDDTMSECVKGQLMIGGVWKKVGEEDLLAIASAVRILV